MLTKLYCKLSTYLTTFKNDERGVTAIEYGLIAAAMAAVLVTIFYSDGDNSLAKELEGTFTDIAKQLKSAGDAIN